MGYVRKIVNVLSRKSMNPSSRSTKQRSWQSSTHKSGRSSFSDSKIWLVGLIKFHGEPWWLLFWLMYFKLFLHDFTPYPLGTTLTEDQGTLISVCLFCFAGGHSMDLGSGFGFCSRGGFDFVLTLA